MFWLNISYIEDLPLRNALRIENFYGRSFTKTNVTWRGELSRDAKSAVACLLVDSPPGALLPAPISVALRAPASKLGSTCIRHAHELFQFDWLGGTGHHLSALLLLSAHEIMYFAPFRRACGGCQFVFVCAAERAMRA